VRIAVIYPKAVAIGLAALAVVVMSGWRSQPAPVEHALVAVGKFSVEVWRDPADGELALQWQGADSWTLVRGRRVFRVIEGRLAQLEVYAATADLWRRIRAEYGLSPDQVDSALRSGDEVGRPSLMDVPSLDRPSRPYLFVRDFGTKVSYCARRQIFPCPPPGRLSRVYSWRMRA
jgi:hypothetical protein